MPRGRPRAPRARALHRVRGRSRRETLWPHVPKNQSLDREDARGTRALTRFLLDREASLLRGGRERADLVGVSLQAELPGHRALDAGAQFRERLAHECIRAEALAAVLVE